MEEKSTRTKPKLLCLHDIGSNNIVTSYQTEGLKLSTNFECIFMHAPHISDGFPSFDGQIAGPFYCWADILQRPAIPETILEGQLDESLDCLAQFCIANGPFDGVYGFSQGASIVTNFSHTSIWKDRFQMVGSEKLVTNNAPCENPYTPSNGPFSIQNWAKQSKLSSH